MNIETGINHEFWTLKKKVGVAVIAVALAAGVPFVATHMPQILKFFEQQPGQTETIPTPPRLGSANWQMMTNGDIKAHAKAPEITSDFTAGKETEFLTAVSPALQEKAKAAGYTIIYQGDPNDTTGRTIVAKNRQSDGQDPFKEDLGFGDTQFDIRGVFKTWVPKPSDSQQKNDVYALLENPITGQSYLVDVSLKPFSVSPEAQPTFFMVDNLDISYDMYKQLIFKNGSWLPAVNMPDDLNDPNAKIKKLEDFPTFNDLLKKNISLDSIMQPGDYVDVWKNGESIMDENRIAQAMSVTVRRFGGMKAWEAEVGITSP